MVKQLVSCFLVVLVIAACKKDPVIVVTNTDRISASSWKFDHATSGGVDITNHPMFPTCVKDNIYVFNSNLTGSVDEGLNICSPSTAGAFTWSFQSNETILHMSSPLFSGGSTDFTIVTLNNTNLVVSTVLPGTTTVVEVTFKH